MMDRRVFIGIGTGGIASLALGCATKKTAQPQQRSCVDEIARFSLQEKIREVYRLVKLNHDNLTHWLSDANNWWLKAAINVGTVPTPNNVFVTAEEYLDENGKLMYESLRIDQTIDTGPNSEGEKFYNEDFITWIDIGADGFSSERHPCRKYECSWMSDCEVITRFGTNGPIEHTQTHFSDSPQKIIDEANIRYEKLIDLLLCRGHLLAPPIDLGKTNLKNTATKVAYNNARLRSAG